MSSSNQNPKTFLCTRPWTSFQIHDHKGNVNPCCWSKVNCGNINNTCTEEIWNGPVYKWIRKLMSKGFIEKICSKDCPILLGEFTDLNKEPISDVYKENWLLQTEEIEKRITILKSKPTMMRVVPTLSCNLNCVMCFQDRNDTIELSSDLDLILSNYFPNLNELTLVGGEPLISKECINIIKSMDPLRYPDLHLGLITNGTMVTNSIIELLSNRRISWILVSMDAATGKTYEKIRGGSWERVIDGIIRLKKLRDSQNCDWRLLIGFTFMRSNMFEAMNFIDLTESLGVECTFTPVFGNWHNESFFLSDIEELTVAIELVSGLEHRLEENGIGTKKAKRIRIMLESLIGSKRLSA